MSLMTILREISPAVPLGALIFSTGKSLCLPFYHSIQGAEELLHIKHLYKLRTTEQFEKDIDYLLANFKAIDLDTL